ncbi:conserved hypothetical protein [Culex quinquefasciatus]|uniref:Uncharacterized protein n=1 Tax=Culex quinquefasciatus TaxID=7176 RepID=B0XIA5_CULQU|nr:conserved hypothetical protein [Culex quinquefasciatus]|eukprot:XP_001869377.1 conserved hypothetical protein [Culex quinquefasciatus]
MWDLLYAGGIRTHAFGLVVWDAEQSANRRFTL